MLIDIVLVYAAGRGGLEDVITNVSRELKCKGHKVRVFQAYPPEHREWERNLPEIHYYSSKKNSSEETLASLAKGYSKALSRYGTPDIILATHAPSLSFICREAVANVEGVMPPIISWLHGPPEYFGNEELLRYSDAHLAISTQIGESIKNYIYPEIPVYYVGNPVSLDETKEIKVVDNAIHLFYIGRMHQHQKRLDILFKALSKFKYDWKLTCIGQGPDEEAIKKLATQLGIEMNIEWLGWKDNPWEYVKEATALVLSSDYEGFSIVMLESLGRGLPVISTNCSGAVDIIDDGENGFLFPIGDYDGLTEILNKIIEKTVEHPSSEKCRRSVQKFKPNVVTNNIEMVLSYFFYNGNKELDGIQNYLVKDQMYSHTHTAGALFNTLISGVEYLGTTQREVDFKYLKQFFTLSFLDQLQFDTEDNTKALVCYPKITMLNYKLSKAVINFTLLNEVIDQEGFFTERINYNAKLINENGYWKINQLQLEEAALPQVSERLPKNLIKKVLLVSTNNSGSSNTVALYKQIPQDVLQRFDVELFTQENTDAYIQKVQSADILVLTEANVLQDKNYYNPSQIIIDLWHGFPLKAMGYAAKNEPYKNNITDRWQHINYVGSYSQMFNELMTKCFQVDKGIFKITGMPRNDFLFKDITSNVKKLFNKELNLSINGRKKIAFFLPTYRHVAFNNRKDTSLNRNNLFGFNELNSTELNHFLEKNDLELVVKLHPVDKENLRDQISTSKNIHFLTDEMLRKYSLDLYEVLNVSDLLITDYSSVYFDYLLTKKPILFISVDIEEYIKNRGFIISEYEKWMPGPKVKDQKSFERNIIQLLEDVSFYQMEREWVLEQIHFYKDAQSSQRVWDFISNIATSI